MSNPVRDAMQAALATMSPPIDTVWENRVEGPYNPQPGVPYQRVDLDYAAPVNSEVSASFIEQGFLQVRLCYPDKQGPAPLEARFALIRSTFYRGRSLDPVGGVVTTISRTPELGPVLDEPGRYCRPVRIYFHAHVTA